MTMQRETQPIDGHSDPNALLDVWLSVGDEFERIEQQVKELEAALRPFVRSEISREENGNL